MSLSTPAYASLGQQEPGLPVLGIRPLGCACRKVATDRSRRTNLVGTYKSSSWSVLKDTESYARRIDRSGTYKPSWSVFEGTEGYAALRRSNKVTEHYDVVTYTTRKNCPTEMEFSFVVDNTADVRKEHAIVEVYSTQDRRLVFSGFLVKPGNKNELLRYEHADRAFVVRKSSVVTDGTFEGARDADVCAFTVMVTQVKEIPPSPPLRWWGARARGRDEVDGPVHTNLLEGKPTFQRFETIKIEYTDAPVHIYNFVILLEESGVHEEHPTTL